MSRSTIPSGNGKWAIMWAWAYKVFMVWICKGPMIVGLDLNDQDPSNW
jgi:hypothetical protein